ncbi:MAG: amidase [Candidatus Rokubacteria bacterium RIFCSPHIGHO2_12_FULL_73_22]|nr:MAG: amidase [Candidatus Rokubacteria bacterium RIFCSPHIGHO2_02_FULL_73_26]OGL03227.1 MAG: amidase [Candidatus Rokubacteria bacterium RIFCSPHIGHO2_12_FULL_73_22]OGL08364.1 MAG: amidase [Candidatus Rokubacteria bacterium RIFCSPLOWO2_02_FULL_73_56]OGL24401.1 MAG: amidase [Candidatus Rokubacteria bacterium RIFCSPLOWO2_12_FULL_73_47]
MSAFAEYAEHDGLGLAELVRNKEVTPSELLEAARARIEAGNPTINAVVHRMYDQARAAVAGGLPDGPFRGVPFLLKDLGAKYAGVPTGAGNRLLRDIPAPLDSEIVRRYKAAGVVILGKTNTPEFGLVPFTEPAVAGPTRNPWDLGRTPGGSSGGSAAAVAARMVPLAGGGDGGGSIRIPASCCGVFGLKPTRGRTPTGPDTGEVWRGFAQEHVLTRSVRDSAAMLDAIAGADVGAPYAAPPQARSFLAEVGTEPGRLRVAFTAQPFLGHAVHDDCVQGLEDTVRLLRELGHTVVEATPRIEREAFAVAFLTIVVAEARAEIEWAAGQARRAPAPGDFEPATWGLGLLGRALSASDYANASRYLQRVAREIGSFFERHDVLLTPTLSAPPVPIGSLQPSRAERAVLGVLGRLHAGWALRAMGMIRQLAGQVFDFIPFTPVFNVTGQPAMSVPLCWNAAGLPIGMHVVGRFGDEATLFRLAGQLERARPWRARAPAGPAA